MRVQTIVALGGMWIVSAAVGCGGTVDVGTGGTGGSAGDSSSSSVSGGAGGGGAGGSTGGSVPAGFCGEACAKTAEGSCLGPADCEAYCDAHAPDWAPSVGEAFAKCAAEHPLCFESIDGCILAEMYPADSTHEVILTGTGFDAWNGKHLRVWHDPDAGAPFGSDVVLSGGQFAFDWLAPFQPSDAGGPLLLLYIDVDDDGACTPAADLTHSVNTEWNGDYLAPVFSAALTPPLNDADFVCSFTP